MKYLNDSISFVLPIANEDGYIPYDVMMFSPLYNKPWVSKFIFRGSVFCKKGEKKRVYLNDIINSISYRYDGMDAVDLVKGERSAALRRDRSDIKPGNYLFEIHVTSPSLPDFIYIESIMSYNKDLRSPILNTFDINGSSEQLYTFPSIRSKVLPHIPSLKKQTHNFYFAPAFILNKKFYETAKYTEGALSGTAFLFLKAVDDNYNYVSDSETFLINSPAICTQLYNKNYNYLTSDSRAKYVVAWDKSISDVVPRPGFNTTKVAIIDQCPSEYYLIWADRTGGYQSQPFSKKNIRTETFNRQNIITFDERERLYLTQVSNSWTLNSDWLSYDEYKCYESLFVSPKTYLYDTAYDELHEVNCELDSWTEKNKENNNKLINLTVRVKDTSTGNILS